MSTPKFAEPLGISEAQNELRWRWVQPFAPRDRDPSGFTVHLIAEPTQIMHASDRYEQIARSGISNRTSPIPACSWLNLRCLKAYVSVPS